MNPENSLTFGLTASARYGRRANSQRHQGRAPLYLDVMHTKRYCPHVNAEAALDRWQECHWHIHQIESNYHFPDPFRFSLNSFLRALKEIPQILQMELQNHTDYQSQIKQVIDSLKRQELLSMLSKKRDYVVHRGMLEVLSNGQVGTTEGRGIKIAIPFPVAPHESTLEAYERFKSACKQEEFLRNLAGPDCDSWPMVRREWRVEDFPDREILELCVEAWQLTGQTLSEIVRFFGGEDLDLSFSCRHNPDKVKIVEFSQRDFFQDVDGIELNA